MAKAPNHSPEVRAAAMAALLAGQSVSAVAKEYKLPKATVSAWKSRHVASLATQKADGKSIGDLLLELVEANIRSIINVAAVTSDPTWLREQSAAELGTFLGITHDKVVRMLEAMGRSDRQDDESPGAEPAA